MARIGNKNRSLQISGILCAAFVLLLLLVKIIDVRHIGPNYTKVGFAALNGLFYKIGYHPFWYRLTQVLGILALLVALAFALLGVYQLVKRKSVGSVDADIVLLGVIYVITILLYLFFNAVVVNYRPVMLEDAMEASFPSSTTVLSCWKMRWRHPSRPPIRCWPLLCLQQLSFRCAGVCRKDRPNRLSSMYSTHYW